MLCNKEMSPLQNDMETNWTFIPIHKGQQIPESFFLASILPKSKGFKDLCPSQSCIHQVLQTLTLYSGTHIGLCVQ